MTGSVYFAETSHICRMSELIQTWEQQFSHQVLSSCRLCGPSLLWLFLVVSQAVSHAGGPANNSTLNSTFPDFSGVQMTSKVHWDSSSTIFNTSHYDSVQRQQYYTSVIQLGISNEVRSQQSIDFPRSEAALPNSTLLCLLIRYERRGRYE